MINVSPRMPAAARDNMARSVIVREYCKIAIGIPGTSRSITALVASGVTSRLEKPVPPVVSTS